MNAVSHFLEAVKYQVQFICDKVFRHELKHINFQQKQLAEKTRTIVSIQDQIMTAII